MLLNLGNIILLQNTKNAGKTHVILSFINHKIFL